MTEERKRYLLKGVVDLHVHTAPSISPRELDVGDMAKDAMEYGLAGFVDCQLINKYVCGGKEICFGLMAMNNSVGGFNLKAVSTACEMGTRVISLPTVSAQEHQDFNKRPNVVPFKATGISPIGEKPIKFTDDKGEVVPELVEILEYLAKYHPSVILNMGHGSAAEIDAVIKKAVEVGVSPCAAAVI